MKFTFISRTLHERRMIFCSYSVLSFFVLTIIGSTTAASTEVPRVKGSTSISPEYEELPRSVQDEVFRELFSNMEVLLSFLNAVFQNNPEMEVGKITATDITVLPRKPAVLVGGPELEFDVRITDSKNRQYIVEMQRQFRPYQVGRFQYYGCAALLDGIKEFYTKFVERNQRAPEEHEIYPHVPRVIVIVFSDKLSVRPFIPSLPRVSKEKKTEDDVSSIYSIYCPIDKVATESKLNFLFIDLERFRQKNPASSYEMWVHFMKNTRDGKFNKQLEPMYAKENGIVKALSILRNITPEQCEKLNTEWKKNIAAEALAREEGRVEGRKAAQVNIAKLLFKKNTMSIQEIAETTGLRVEELQLLKGDC